MSGQRSGRSVGRRRSGPGTQRCASPTGAAVRRLAQRLASSAGRRLDDSVPFIDARLPSGIPAACHSAAGQSAGHLSVAAGAAPAGVHTGGPGGGGDDPAGPPRRCSRAGAPAGGVPGQRWHGIGKTTLLNTLLSAADPNDRIVIVEDSAGCVPTTRVVRLSPGPPTLGLGCGHDARPRAPDLRMRGPRRGRRGSRRWSSIYWQPSTPVARAAVERCTRTVPPMCPPVESLAMPAGLNRDGVRAQVAAGLQAVVHVVRDEQGGCAGWLESQRWNAGATAWCAPPCPRRSSVTTR